MTIMFADDFNGYGTNTAFMQDGLYSNVGPPATHLVADPDPNANGIVLENNLPATGTFLRRVFPNTQITVGIAVRLWLSALPFGDKLSPSISLADGNNNVQIAVYVTADGSLSIQKCNGDTWTGQQIGITPEPVLTPNAWNHIEIKAVSDLAAGSVEIRVNGESKIVVDGVNTGAGGYAQLRFDGRFTAGTNISFYFKDLVAWNGEGAHNNDFLGTVTVVGLTPNADVSLGWTPSTGATGWNLIDNSPPDDADDYVTAPFPIPAPAIFSMTQLPIDVSSVRGLITQVRARKQDGGDGSVQISLISAGSDIDGSNRPITTAFTYYEDVFEIDPATGNSWTPAAVDAAEIKLNRTV